MTTVTAFQYTANMYIINRGQTTFEEVFIPEYNIIFSCYSGMNIHRRDKPSNDYRKPGRFFEHIPRKQKDLREIQLPRDMVETMDAILKMEERRKSLFNEVLAVVDMKLGDRDESANERYDD